MDNFKLFFLVIILLTGFSDSLSAQQPDRLSEKEVNLQKLLIDANREKMLGNYESAVSLLKQVLKEEETDDAAAYELARVYEAMEKKQQALEYAEKATEYAPDNIWYYHFLADLLQGLNENKKAASVMERIVELEPDNDYNYFRWAYFLVRSGEVKDALKVYEQLEKQTGLNEDIVRRKHALYLGTGDYKRAAGELERLIEAFPMDVDYRHLLASFYEQINDTQKAKAVYNKILKIAPEDAKARLAIAGEPNATTDEERYIASLKPVFQQPDVAIDLKIGKILPFIQKVAATNDTKLANATLELAAILEEVHSSEAKSYALSADLLYHSGNKVEALEKYQKALELDDTVFLLWEQVMHIYNEQGEMIKLLSFSERAMDYFPNQAIAYYYYSKAAYQIGRSDEAVSLLQQAALMAGKDQLMKLAVQRLLAKVYNETEAFSDADKLFEKLMSKNSKSPELLTDYAFVLAQRGQQLKEAEKMSRQAMEVLSERAEPLHALALVKYQQKQYPEAKNLFQQAVQNDGGQLPQLLEHFGDVLFELGEVSNAIEYWKKAKEKGRSTTELNKKIAAHSN